MNAVHIYIFCFLCVQLAFTATTPPVAPTTAPAKPPVPPTTPPVPPTTAPTTPPVPPTAAPVPPTAAPVPPTAAPTTPPVPPTTPPVPPTTAPTTPPAPPTTAPTAPPVPPTTPPTAPPTTPPPQTSDSADFIFDYVNKARESLKLTSNPNVILVTGITGGGKSTLTHYVTGDYSKMISVEPTGAKAEYTIYDGLDPDVNKTDTSTVSRTFVPELNIDEEKNVFYDCPGFADTRNETVEIATTFLIKSVIENSKNIKIVLVVNYESVTDGHDRQDFDNSLARLTELAQNVPRFANSVSVVITKVPSYFIIGGKIAEVLESSIKNSTARFAANHRIFLQQKGTNAAQKKIQAIDALLQTTPTGDYPRISVFWRPMEAGPLNKIKKMVDGRQSIRNSILKATVFTNFEKTDFGFPLSAETKLKIGQIAQATVAQISTVLANVDRQLLGALQQKIQSIDNFHSRFDALELGLTAIQKSHGTNEPATLNEWIARLKTVISTYGISSIDMDQFNQIAQHENNINILKSIADGTDITAPVRDLIAKSSTATKYQTVEHRWYSFLVHVFNFFTSFEVQKATSAYNVANLADWGQINKPQGLTVSAQTFAEFVKRFPNVPVNEITPDVPKFKELNDIAGVTLRTPVQYACVGDTMTIKGNIGKSSDIQVAKCAQIPLKKINVYLTSTFYVDADLSLPGMAELKIHASKWSVQRATTFNLNGVNGVALPALATPGTPGKPGPLGTNGGNFFGFANEMTNGELLTVTANGGTGANGQSGTGNADVIVQFVNFSDKKSKNWGGGFGGAHEHALSLLRGRGYDVEDLGGENYRLHPRCCGITGQGGKGGFGGQPGLYGFIHGITDAAHVPKTAANAGAAGQNGPNANPCKSNAAEVYCHIHTKKHSLGLKRTRHWDFQFKQHVADPKCPPNLLASTEPIPQQVARLPLDIASGMIAYKTVLVENMNNFAFKNLILNVYTAIEANAQVNQAYTVGAYAVEANALEKQFFRMHEQIDMYPLYRSLMQRIDGYAVANGKNVGEIDRKILSILYTTIFGKAAGIRSAHKSDLIIDVLDYLGTALANVAKLDDVGRIRVISALRDQYRDELADKIKEAQNYINNDIQPEIEALFKKLNTEMDKTVEETIALQERTIKEIQRKEELKRKLRKKSGLQKIVGVVGMVASVASKFNVYAAAISTVINVAAGSIASKIPELDNKNDFVFQMRKINGEEIDAIEQQLNGLKAFVNGDGKALGNATAVTDIGNKLTDFAAKLLKIKTNPTFGATRSVLKEVLEFVNKPLAAIKNASDKVTEAFLKPFEKVSNVLSVVASSISTFKQFKNNDAKIQELGKAIQRDRETLKALMAFEDQIYDKLIPLLDIMQINLKNVTTDAAKKTLVSLDMQKWRLAPTLRDMQKQFATMLHGFGSEYQVASYLQRIEESMNLIINIYDRIQNYQEQTRFAIYMSDLQSADYRNLNVNDPNLQSTINELRFNLHANILLAQYDRAVDAFKQAVFPFAADYLDIYELPKSLQPSKNDSMDSIIFPVSENIKSLSERIHQLNNSVINPNDMLIFNAFFDRYDNGSYGPFYVWKNDEVNQQIQQLFAGKKVYLLADVAKSNSKLNAIKFKSIRLEFRSAKNDQATVDRLNEILSSFHVSLTHMGESNYRCSNQFYTIHSRPLTIEYSFATRRQTPTVRNWAYDKLNSVAPILSPHTIWAIQLENGQFDRLKEFAGTVDLELHGVGQYVKETSNICNTNLGKYYPKKNAQ